jgi:hypothetical protein
MLEPCPPHHRYRGISLLPSLSREFHRQIVLYISGVAPYIERVYSRGAEPFQIAACCISMSLLVVEHVSLELAAVPIAKGNASLTFRIRFFSSSQDEHGGAFSPGGRGESVYYSNRFPPRSLKTSYSVVKCLFPKLYF